MLLVHLITHRGAESRGGMLLLSLQQQRQSRDMFTPLPAGGSWAEGTFFLMPESIPTHNKFERGVRTKPLSGPFRCQPERGVSLYFHDRGNVTMWVSCCPSQPDMEGISNTTRTDSETKKKKNPLLSASKACLKHTDWKKAWMYN